MKSLIIAILITIFVPLSFRQTSVPVDQQDDYEASPQNPFGRLNPDAPVETKQFAFLIGAFECNDRLLNPANGKWFDMKAIRRAEFVLNGYGIQDKNYTNILTSTNIRIYDPANKEWVVSYFKAPFGVGVWKGQFSNGRFELLQGDTKSGSRLSFFDISSTGYSWKGESLNDGTARVFWEFTCTKKKVVG